MRRWKFIVMLSAVFMLPLILRNLGGRLEVFQAYAFPCLAAGIFFVAVRPPFGIPRWVPLFAALGWLGCLLVREAGISRVEPSPRLGITPAENDPLGIKSRSLQRFSALVANTYKIDAPAIVDKSFPSSRAAYRWLMARGDSRLLVVSRGEDWDLVFGSGPDRDSCASADEACRSFLRLAESYDVRVPQEGILVRPSAIEQSLFLVRRPELIHVAAEPVELTAHTLVWLASGLRRAAQSGEQSYAAAEDALYEAGSIFGAWKSIAPLAVSSAILGTIFLAHESELAQSSAQVHQGAVAALLRARKLARRQFDPELFAMILNNLAVSHFYGSRSDVIGDAAISMLREASSVVDEAKHPVLGARIALMNLILLEAPANEKPAVLTNREVYASARAPRSS